MSIFKTLFGKSPEPEAGWKVRPADERPAAWSEPKAASNLPPPIKPQQKEPNPFLDDAMLDTMQLESETLHEDNPYQTHSWEMDPENDTRKLKTIQIGKADKQRQESQFNPYDTGSHRRGWKD